MWNTRKFRQYLGICVFLATLLTQATETELVVQVSNEEGCAPVPYFLEESFKVGNVTVNSVYLCHDGYITVDGGEPSELQNPDDLEDTENSTVIAGGLISSNSSAMANLSIITDSDYFEWFVPCFTHRYEICLEWIMLDEGKKEGIPLIAPCLVVKSYNQHPITLNMQ